MWRTSGGKKLRAFAGSKIERIGQKLSGCNVGSVPLAALHPADGAHTDASALGQRLLTEGSQPPVVAKQSTKRALWRGWFLRLLLRVFIRHANLLSLFSYAVTTSISRSAARLPV